MKMQRGNGKFTDSKFHSTIGTSYTENSKNKYPTHVVTDKKIFKKLIF